MIAEVALRTWPQRWSTLLDSLSVLAGPGLTVLEKVVGQQSFANSGDHAPHITGHLVVVLTVFRALAEEANSFGNDLVASRKRDITTAVTESLGLIVPFLSRTLSAAGRIVVERFAQAQGIYLS